MLNISEYWIEYGGCKNGFFSRNHYFKWLDSCKINYFIKNYDNTDVYATAYRYSSNNIDEADLYGSLYFDLDSDLGNNFAELKREANLIIGFFKSIGLKNNEIQLYFSGSKGFHIVIAPEVLGIIPSTDLNAMWKAWAIYFSEIYKVKSLDLRIYDKKRLFRIPNSINAKTGLYKIPLDINKFNNYSLDDIKKMAVKPCNDIQYSTLINRDAAIKFYKKSQNFYRKPKTDNSVNTEIKIPETKQEFLPCVKVLLESGAMEGYRNNTLVLLASAILQSGYKLEETLELMHDWNQLNNPPLSRNEVDATTKSAYSMLLSGRRYGCNAFRESGFCISNDCKFLDKEEGEDK